MCHTRNCESDFFLWFVFKLGSVDLLVICCLCLLASTRPCADNRTLSSVTIISTTLPPLFRLRLLMFFFFSLSLSLSFPQCAINSLSSSVRLPTCLFARQPVFVPLFLCVLFFFSVMTPCSYIAKANCKTMFLLQIVVLHDQVSQVFYLSVCLVSPPLLSLPFSPPSLLLSPACLKIK